METQQETNLFKVRQALNNGMRLTVLSAISIASTIDLRKYVSMLRKEGMNIIGEPTQNGNKKRFNTYYLKIE
jgi:hypothetical protein